MKKQMRLNEQFDYLKGLTNEQLEEMKSSFWNKNKRNAIGEIQYPLFFNEIYRRMKLNN